MGWEDSMVNSPSNRLERKHRSIWGVGGAFFIALLDVERVENIFEIIHFLTSQKNLKTWVILEGI